MKKDRKEFESWANKELKKLQGILGLDSYRLYPIKPSDENASTFAFRYPYKDMYVRYSEEVFEDWKKGDKAEARYILLHELCHALTDPLYAKSTSRFVSKNEIEDEREALTDHITNIIGKFI